MRLNSPPARTLHRPFGVREICVLVWALAALLVAIPGWAAERGGDHAGAERAGVEQAGVEQAGVEQAGVEQTEPSSARAQFAERESRYRIQPGDLVEFQFRFTPEFNQSVRVQPDGYIPLQDAGELKVGGLTVAEAREATIKAYSEKLREPIVSVILKEFSMPHFIVGGEVGKPGRYDLKGDVMLSEAIQIAGGFNSGAHTSEVLLFRRVAKDWVETKKFNFKEALQNGLQEDVLLRPGDSIYISRSKLGKVQKFMESSKLGLFFNPLSVF